MTITDYLRQTRENAWSSHQLGAEAGYPNKAAFAAALYRLAKRYPSADHFRWQA